MSSKNLTRKRSPHDFVFKQELGHGSYSTVYKVFDKHSVNHVYAIKVCSKAHIIKENKVKYVTIEKNTLNLLARACHPGIVRLYYTFHDEENLYFVLDYASGGELLQLLHKMGRFSESWSLHFSCQLIDTIEFIHSKGIIHRDLKPENVLLNRFGRLMITDFGTAATPLNQQKQEDDQNESPRCSSFVGTAEYVSPELLLSNQCDFASDIWALGCIIFQFIMGVPPFRGKNELQTFEKIASLDYLWNNQHYSSNKIDPVIIKLVQKILVLNPQERLTLTNMKKDEWFDKVDWNNKDHIWRGIWQVSEPAYGSSNGVGNGINNGISSGSTNGSTGGFPPRQNLISNKPLHVIDTPIRSIPITKQKKKKPTKVSNTTSSIVEWRKKLGISLQQAQVPSSVPINNSKLVVPSPPLVPQPTSTYLRPAVSPRLMPSSTTPSPSVKRSTSQPSLSKAAPSHDDLYRPASSPDDPNITDHNSNSHNNNITVNTTTNNNYNDIHRPKTMVLKQDYVNIFEIPFKPDGPPMSLESYSKINNDIITELVSKFRPELKSFSKSPVLSTLFKDGTLSYKNDGFSKHMVNVGDPDLSMYDFEFYEQKNDGFLILEKYKYKIWFISLPTIPVTNGLGPIVNSDENWVDCFFRARQIMDEHKTVINKLKNVHLDEPFMALPSPIESRPSSSNVNDSIKESAAISRKTQISDKSVNTKTSTFTESTSQVVRNVSSPPSFGNGVKRNGQKNSPLTLQPPLSSPAMVNQSKKMGYRSPSSPIYVRSPTLSPQSQSMKKYAVPNNMVISSSRYEVLNALKQNSGTNVASSGASAAFKNLQKKKMNQHK
ncbi:hypothetical protein HG535_0D05570 [Zygotorulaspora mrakii]|uniref:non-specific serine/threonine protein kinase n=1 Tax=Zygotorulaspora mrakii TaxID=42260 RepID=A0A7H9B2G6_ZYGMR|nr:uncharacterized protein HG535_0D05570 [Zygotorulaspora mrakii]QLG72848.1 hypothetical protein HG535_0D05570 [Zygotorulaspora mrakii]